MATITSDCPPSPHQTSPPLQSDARDHAYTSVQLSHPPNIISLNFHVDLVVSPSSCHTHFVAQPLSSHSVVPPYDIVFSSSILDFTLVGNEDQATDRVGVAQPTCTIIHEEYDWELEHQHSAKDDPLLSEPPPFFPDICGEPAIHDSACVSLSTDAPIVDHSQDTPDINPSSDNGEDKLFIENPLNLSYSFSGKIEEQFFHFPSTPLFDL